ncbi:hypothetical protein F4802DRAFT_334828 [Xylaria palmicola]|nr:hypothetical protein F4802DRAFT_334828 [Xylaria palmicola]
MPDNRRWLVSMQATQDEALLNCSLPHRQMNPYQAPARDTASYGDFVAYASARNPSLSELSSLLRGTGNNRRASNIISMEVNDQGQGNQYGAADRKDMVAQIRDFEQRKPEGCRGGLLIVIEDPAADEVREIGALLDIDPFFFAGHFSVSYQDVERSSSSPLQGLLPSRVVAADHINIHFQTVLDLGGVNNAGGPPLYKTRTGGNSPRSVRVLPSLSNRHIGIVRSCTSVLKKKLRGGAWICVIFTDPSLSHSISQFPEARPINVEDVVDLPTYSSFKSSLSRSSNIRSLSPAENLSSILRDQRMILSTVDGTPSILELAYYPIRIALADWKLYVQLMSRYVKHFELSFHMGQNPSESFARHDLLELHRWRRRSSQSLHKVRMTRAFVQHWRKRDDSAHQKGDRWDLLAMDILHIEKQIEHYASTLESLNPIIMSLIQLANSNRSISEASDVRRLTYIAVVFIPLSFVAGLFSMGDDFLPGRGSFWVYWVASIPITLAVLAATSLHTLKAYPLQWYRKLRERLREPIL